MGKTLTAARLFADMLVEGVLHGFSKVGGQSSATEKAIDRLSVESFANNTPTICVHKDYPQNQKIDPSQIIECYTQEPVPMLGQDHPEWPQMREFMIEREMNEPLIGEFKPAGLLVRKQRF